MPTGIDVWLADATSVTAPQDGFVQNAGQGEVLVAGADGVLVLRGPSVRPAVEDGHAVTAGAVLATVGPGRVWLQIRTGPDQAVPAFVRPEYAAGWLALTRDPAPLLGLSARPTGTDEDAGELVRRREQALAGVQEQYYRRPPRIERGWREYLCSVDGRSYLDMVNNVASVGHAHPRIHAAVSRQTRLLNTNSRFHYAAITEYGERLAATLPDPLDTVFLVNSGSEAVDLALRLAMATTGRHDVVVVDEEQPVSLVLGRPVVAEVEAVLRVEPAGVGVEALGGSLDGGLCHAPSNIVALATIPSLNDRKNGEIPGEPGISHPLGQRRRPARSHTSGISVSIMRPRGGVGKRRKVPTDPRSCRGRPAARWSPRIAAEGDGTLGRWHARGSGAAPRWRPRRRGSSSTRASCPC